MPGDLFRSRGRAGQTPAANDEEAGLFRASSSATQRISESDLHAAVDALPSLPLVVQMILTKVGADSKADAHDLEGLVSQDMAIATRLLKMVNLVSTHCLIR